MGNQARALVDDERHLIDIPGRWRLETKGRPLLVVGDRILLEKSTDGYRLIEVIPRRNEFTRRLPGTRKLIPQVIAVNLDLAVVIASVAEPATPYGLVDRLLVTAELGGIEPVLVVNKVDLADKETINNWINNYRYAAKQLLFTSAVNKNEIDLLGDMIHNRIVLFAGASGVGKSTLANCIDPELNIKIGEISQSTGKGKHTTTSSELHATALGGWLTDTPGLRECGPFGKTPLNLTRAFPELRKFAPGCHFRDCVHRAEIRCAVREMVGTPELPVERYKSYLKLLGEAEEEQSPGFKNYPAH